MLNKLTSYLSFIAILGYLISFAYLNAFYGAFGINILNHASYTEILLNLSGTALIIISAFYGNTYILFQLSPTEKSYKERFIESKLYVFIVNREMIIFFSLLILLASTLIAFHGSLVKHGWIAILIILLLIITARIQYFANNPIGFVTITFLLITLFQFSSLWGMRTAYGILSKEPNRKYSIVTNDEIFETSAELIYVGETTSSIFLCQKKDTSIIVLNRSEIKKITVKKKVF